MQNTMTLTVEQARGFVLAAPKSDVRYYLNGVLFDAPKGRAVVTDGHVLIAGNIATEYRDPGYEAVIVRREVLAEIAKGGKQSDIIKVHFGSDGYRLSRKSSDGQILEDQIDFMPIDGRYPDYERVMPREVSGEMVNFDPALSSLAARALAKVASTSGVPMIDHNGNAGAIMAYTGTGERAIAVLMPLRAPRNGHNATAEMAAFLDTDAESKAA